MPALSAAAIMAASGHGAGAGTLFIAKLLTTEVTTPGNAARLS